MHGFTSVVVSRCNASTQKIKPTEVQVTDKHEVTACPSMADTDVESSQAGTFLLNVVTNVANGSLNT